MSPSNSQSPFLSLDRITEYLEAAGQVALPSAPLFKPIRNNRRGTTDTGLTADGANVRTTQDYFHRMSRPEDSPVFNVSY